MIYVTQFAVEHTCLFMLQRDSGEETGSLCEHSAQNHISVSNRLRNYSPLLHISAYSASCVSSVLSVMNRKTSTATHFSLLPTGLWGCFCVSWTCVLCLYRYEWQGKIEEDSEVLLVSSIRSRIHFQVKETHNIV